MNGNSASDPNPATSRGIRALLTLFMAWCVLIALVLVIVPFGLPDEPLAQRITSGVGGLLFAGLAFWVHRVRDRKHSWQTAAAIVMAILVFGIIGASLTIKFLR